MERLESKENLFFKYRIERPLKAKEGETVLKVACLALMVVSVALLTSLVFFPGAVVPLLIVSGAVLVLVPAGIGRYLFIPS